MKLKRDRPDGSFRPIISQFIHICLGMKCVTHALVFSLRFPFSEVIKFSCTVIRSVIIFLINLRFLSLGKSLIFFPLKLLKKWEPSNARQRLDKHVPTVTKLFTLQRQQYRRGANILVTLDINNEARRFLCNR
jgi:hypothetical protein